MPVTTIRRTKREQSIYTRSRIARAEPVPNLAPPLQWDFALGMRFVWRWRTAIVVFVLLVTGLTALYSWRIPDRYTATAMLLSDSPSERLSTLASLGPRITMALGGAGMHRGKVMYPTLLRSRSVIEPTLTVPMPTKSSTADETTTLASIIGTTDPEQGCEAVRNLMATSHDLATGVCHLAVTMEDPVTAAVPELI